MGIFQKSTNDQAYLKAGFLGFTGSGKTFTGTKLAIGLHKLLKDRGLPKGDSPIMFLDTETGSDWVASMIAKEGIELQTAKTRTFAKLVEAVAEAEAAKAILIIDSITHFWRELTESYAKRKNRTRLHFQDWAWLKQKWGEFTDAYVNSQCHIIMCGRAGYEYDYFEDETGKKELEKTGIKMKAETETGYEPSILVMMTRHQKFDADHPENTSTVRYGTVLKDRGVELDGEIFKNPTFEDFLPHINRLNLGGVQRGVDTSTSSESIVPPDSGGGRLEKEQIEICLDEIKSVLSKHHEGQSAAAKKAKADLLEKYFSSRSWERITTYPLLDLEVGRENLWKELEGKPYEIPTANPPVQQAEEEAGKKTQGELLAKGGEIPF